MRVFKFLIAFLFIFIMACDDDIIQDSNVDYKDCQISKMEYCIDKADEKLYSEYEKCIEDALSDTWTEGAKAICSDKKREFKMYYELCFNDIIDDNCDEDNIFIGE